MRKAWHQDQRTRITGAPTTAELHSAGQGADHSNQAFPYLFVADTIIGNDP